LIADCSTPEKYSRRRIFTISVRRDEEIHLRGEDRMKGSELRVKRVSAGILGAILCLKAGLGLTRFSGIERGTVPVGPAEAARIEAALEELAHAKRKADEVAMSLGWPSRSDEVASKGGPTPWQRCRVSHVGKADQFGGGTKAEAKNAPGVQARYRRRNISSTRSSASCQ
jgi:hypothetical protein